MQKVQRPSPAPDSGMQKFPHSNKCGMQNVQRTAAAAAAAITLIFLSPQPWVPDSPSHLPAPTSPTTPTAPTTTTPSVHRPASTKPEPLPASNQESTLGGDRGGGLEGIPSPLRRIRIGPRGGSNLPLRRTKFGCGPVDPPPSPPTRRPEIGPEGPPLCPI